MSTNPHLFLDLLFFKHLIFFIIGKSDIQRGGKTERKIFFPVKLIKLLELEMVLLVVKS